MRTMTAYGPDALPEGMRSLSRAYVAVVDEVAWRLCRDRLPRAPTAVIAPDSLERSALQKLASELPAGVDLVGIGGGLVIDATKFLAVAIDTTPLLAPSITSNNAPFSDAISVREAGVPTGMVVPDAPRRVVVDFRLIRAAEPRLNRAGYADLLAHETALADCRRAALAGRLKPDEDLYNRMSALLERAHELAPDVAAVSARGIEGLMRLFEDASELIAAHPSSPIGAGSEHLLAWNLEAVTGRHFIHGEAVALGIVTAAVAQGIDVDRLRTALDVARVSYRIGDLGLSWDEYERALHTIADYNRRVRHMCSVFDAVEWTPELLAAVRVIVDARASRAAASS